MTDTDETTNVVPFSTMEWNDRIALDLALVLERECSIEELLEDHKLEKSDIRAFMLDKVFKTRVEHFRREIATEGLGFRMKARVQAEELLTTSWGMIHDPVVSPNVRADLIKSTVKWAGLEPKPDALEGGGGGGGAGVRININLGNADKPLSIETGEVYDNDYALAKE
jgi:hypothetical protein